MPTFELVMIGVTVDVTGGVTNSIILPATTNKEALELSDNVHVLIDDSADVGGTVLYKAISTSLLIRLNVVEIGDPVEPEPIPSGFLALNAKILIKAINAQGATYLEWYHNGSLFSNVGSGFVDELLGIYVSSALSLSGPIIAVSSYGVKFTYPLGDGPLLIDLDYLTIRGEYILWSTSLDIQPRFQVIPNVTEISITDGEGLLNTVDEIVTEYPDPLDPTGETIISNTIPAVDFISQTAEEIVFLLEETLPGDIPDCTFVIVSLVDSLAQKVYIGTIKTECPTEPDIEIPEEPGTLDPESGLLLGIGYGGIRLAGSAFENDMEIIWPVINGGIDFGGDIGDSLRFMGDVSGIYTLIEDQTHDRLYDRLPEQTFVDVKIPDPFIKTGYIKK